MQQSEYSGVVRLESEGFETLDKGYGLLEYIVAFLFISFCLWVGVIWVIVEKFYL